ncbi:glycerol-3-phosphate acyltransferase [Alcanivorax hongdengensis A-11-3]|uniref:Glycerol-3-phosphate acyltransferase n=1 Tax=Alcanivorax hongdengensis A-11-3 TaxID=1177179 RepID=L0WG11_9GAMM|nr:glycerol-3-phosphate 1-O-acyltransferase PlsB [Alcanivorax hongdengensis]EKF75092.1 glycerol-3-phosphate acyltransferase [Alcanivorax hongdengensis A-11-3]
MNFWFGLDRLAFFVVRVFLRLCTRANALPTDPKELQLNPDIPVIYVLRDRSAADAAVADQSARRLGLAPALAGMNVGKTHLSRSYFHLYRRQFSNGRQRTALSPARLEKLVKALQDDPQADVQLVPVSVFWGRRPEKESSLWRIIFSDNWSPAGFIKKFFIILTQGRQLYVQFSKPMSLRALVDRCERQKQQQVVRKASRILRVHFRRQQEAAIGPDLSHRRTLSSSVVDSSTVRAVIREEMTRTGEKEEKLEAQARRYALEIAADYSHTVIRFLELILNWVWNRLYGGIRLYNMDNLTEVAGDHEIIYVPCHRSHIDYLLLSFVMYRNNLVPPHIAAGINLNLPVVGTILRRGGAFFMRRSFRDNPLYAAVFSEYLHTITARGFSIEYFVEGGRSRSGRMLKPRTGMLAMTVRSYLRDARKPVAFVPVYIGYEKVIEAGSYIGELHGKKKQKESVGGLMKSLSILRSHFGQVHVNFGKPIKLSDYLDQHNRDWRSCEVAPSDTPPWFKHMINELGQEVVESINAAAVANPVNLMSLAVLASSKHTMDLQQLRQQLQLYIELLKQAPYSDTAAIANTDADAIIDYGLENEFLERIKHPLGDVVTTDEKTALQMAYVRNNSLHLFILPGLICSLFMNARSINIDVLQRMIQLLYPFLRNEYFLHWQDGEELAAAVDRILVVLEQQQLISRNDNCLHGAPVHTHESDLLSHLGQTVMPSLERYYLTIRLLVQYGSGKLNSDQLGELAHQTAQRLSLLYEFNSPEFFDKVVLKHFIAQLYSTGLVMTDDQGALTFDEKLQALDDEARRILSPDISDAIQRVTRVSNPEAFNPSEEPAA